MMCIENFHEVSDTGSVIIDKKPAVTCHHDFAEPVRLDPIHIRQSFSIIECGFRHAQANERLTATIGNKEIHFTIDEDGKPSRDVAFSFASFDEGQMAQYEDLKNGVRRTDLTDKFSRNDVMARMQKGFAEKMLETLEDSGVAFPERSSALKACNAMFDLWYCEEIQMHAPQNRQWHNGDWRPH